MLKKVTVTRVFKNTANNDGVPYTFKNGKNAGKPFTRVGIKTDKTADEVYSNNAFPDSATVNIEEGKEYLLDLYEDNGFKNFKFPTKEALAAYEQALLDAANAQ